jgi:hypothetical protein
MLTSDALVSPILTRSGERERIRPEAEGQIPHPLRACDLVALFRDHSTQFRMCGLERQRIEDPDASARAVAARKGEAASG